MLYIYIFFFSFKQFKINKFYINVNKGDNEKYTNGFYEDSIKLINIYQK